MEMGPGRAPRRGRKRQRGGPLSPTGDSGRMLSLPLPWLHPTPTRSLEGGRAGLRSGYREGGDTQSPKFPLPSRVSPLGFPRPRSPRSAGRGACPGDSTEPWWLEQARYFGRSELGAGVPACLSSGGFGARSLAKRTVRPS